MNGCDYKLHGGKTDPNDSSHGIEGESDLICPGGGPVMDLYQNATTHAENKTLCKLTIVPYTNKKEITFTNTAGSPNDFDMKLVESVVSYIEGRQPPLSGLRHGHCGRRNHSHRVR